MPREWLMRARRSRSAEPLREPVYRQAPLAAETRRLDCTLIASVHAIALVSPQPNGFVPVHLTLAGEREVQVVAMRTLDELKSLLALTPPS